MEREPPETAGSVRRAETKRMRRHTPLEKLPRPCAAVKGGTAMINFRLARPEDGPALADIYAPYVRDTAISFELSPPSAGEFRGRIARCLEQYPWIVCEVDGTAAGYAYAGELKERPAYRWNVELSLYLAPAFQHRGIGSALLSTLLELLRLQGYRYAYACITASNLRSIRLHERFGFAEAGRFPRSGYKLGEWHDVVWLAKCLQGDGAFSAMPSPPLPLPLLEGRMVAELLESGAEAVPRTGDFIENS